MSTAPQTRLQQTGVNIRYSKLPHQFVLLWVVRNDSQHGTVPDTIYSVRTRYTSWCNPCSAQAIDASNHERVSDGCGGWIVR